MGGRRILGEFTFGEIGYTKDMQAVNFTDPAIQQIFRDNHISRAYLVGSFARGEATESSDIDILYEKIK
jgi:predicted nucleotidyltransferase